MSIVTKTGDKGETSLMFGRRVSKTDPRVEAYGCVDELTSALGLARAFLDETKIVEEILVVQKELIVVMGELATASEDLGRYAESGYKLVTPEMTDRVAALIADYEKDKSLYPKDWVIPGKTRGSAALDLARTAARRAERAVLVLADGPGSEIARYLNRLSDLCWILARFIEKSVEKS